MKENIILAAVAVSGLVFCLSGIRTNQLGAHNVRFFIAGKLQNEITVTNPMFITYVGDAQGRAVRQTNYYWHVWEIFK